jgi:hypothetical protein
MYTHETKAKYSLVFLYFRILGISVSIVSGYGLDDRANEVWSLAGAMDFSSSLCVQAGSEAHPAFCTIGNEGPFPGVKRGRSVTLTTQPI